MVQRSYAKDIGRVSLILGCLMIIAALLFMTTSFFVLPDPSAATFKMGWVFQHPLLAGLLQLSLGSFLAIAARAFLRGNSWGRSALRAALAMAALGFTIFSIMWVRDVGSFPTQVGGAAGRFPPVPFQAFAALASLSWIIPMVLGVRYLGTPRGRLDDPTRQ